MEQLNNLDVFFLIIVGISALVGIARGFTKELLSVLGWVAAGSAVYFLTPVVDPMMQKYISSEILSKLVSGMLVLLVVCVFWVLAVDKIATSIRQSKLSPLDRIFGLLFGALRGALVVVLIVMMISSIVPEDTKKGVFASSQIFSVSEEFVEPIKSMIPQETIESVQMQMAKIGFGPKKDEDAEENTKEKSSTSDKDAEAKDKKEDKSSVSEVENMKNVVKAVKAVKAIDELSKGKSSDKNNILSEDEKEAFMKLVQPKTEGEETQKENTDASEKMSDELQKLVDKIEEQTIEINDEDFGL